jgi:hypothetical protein
MENISSVPIRFYQIVPKNSPQSKKKLASSVKTHNPVQQFYVGSKSCINNPQHIQKQHKVSSLDIDHKKNLVIRYKIEMESFCKKHEVSLLGAKAFYNQLIITDAFNTSEYLNKYLNNLNVLLKDVIMNYGSYYKCFSLLGTLYIIKDGNAKSNLTLINIDKFAQLEYDNIKQACNSKEVLKGRPIDINSIKEPRTIFLNFPCLDFLTKHKKCRQELEYKEITEFIENLKQDKNKYLISHINQLYKILIRKDISISKLNFRLFQFIKKYSWETDKYKSSMFSNIEIFWKNIPDKNYFLDTEYFAKFFFKKNYIVPWSEFTQQKTNKIVEFAKNPHIINILRKANAHTENISLLINRHQGITTSNKQQGLKRQATETNTNTQRDIIKKPRKDTQGVLSAINTENDLLSAMEKDDREIIKVNNALPILDNDPELDELLSCKEIAYESAVAIDNDPELDELLSCKEIAYESAVAIDNDPELEPDLRDLYSYLETDESHPYDEYLHNNISDIKE